MQMDDETVTLAYQSLTRPGVDLRALGSTQRGGMSRITRRQSLVAADGMLGPRFVRTQTPACALTLVAACLLAPATATVAQTAFAPYPLLSHSEVTIRRRAKSGGILNLEWDVSSSLDLLITYSARPRFMILKEGGRQNDPISYEDLIRLRTSYQNRWCWVAASTSGTALTAECTATPSERSLFRVRSWIEGIGPAPQTDDLRTNFSTFALQLSGDGRFVYSAEDEGSPVRLTRASGEASEFQFSTPQPRSSQSPAPSPAPRPAPVPNPAAPSAGSPTLRTEVVASAIYFYAANASSSTYSCTVRYRYSWMDFGSLRSKNDEANVTIPANFNGQILRVTHDAPGLALNSSSLTCK